MPEVHVKMILAHGRVFLILAGMDSLLVRARLLRRQAAAPQTQDARCLRHSRTLFTL